MKNTLLDCFCGLVGSDLNIFDDILSHKYRKFLRFFTIISDYTEDINGLNYEFTTKDILSVKVEFMKAVEINKEDLIKELEESGYSIEKIKVKPKSMKFRISYQE